MSQPWCLDMAPARLKHRYAFTVSHGAIKLRVKVLPTVRDVGKAYHQGSTAKMDVRGCIIYGYFEPSECRSKYLGTIYLCENTRLFEIVPHEVCHAVLHYLHSVSVGEDSDEKFACAVGLLTARILSAMDQSE